MTLPTPFSEDRRDETAAMAVYLLANLRAQAAADGWTEAELVEKFDPPAAEIVNALVVL